MGAEVFDVGKVEKFIGFMLVDKAEAGKREAFIDCYGDWQRVEDLTVGKSIGDCRESCTAESALNGAKVFKRFSQY